MHDASRLPALVAERDGEIAGVLTYNVCDGELEIVSINAVEPGGGVGTALLAAATELARAGDCKRVWLVTTNDNLDALRFYQRRGLRLVAVHRGAVDDARRLKPSIPEVGEYGIPLHDELELELRL
jgi:N-acetylglutamate synthase-like GNAT family acetyltransferase